MKIHTKLSLLPGAFFFSDEIIVVLATDHMPHLCSAILAAQHVNAAPVTALAGESANSVGIGRQFDQFLIGVKYITHLPDKSLMVWYYINLEFLIGVLYKSRILNGLLLTMAPMGHPKSLLSCCPDLHDTKFTQNYIEMWQKVELFSCFCVFYLSYFNATNVRVYIYNYIYIINIYMFKEPLPAGFVTFW